MPEVIDRTYRAYGAAADYFQNPALECLLDSGAGTGKTYCWMQKANYTARMNPGSRQLFCRVTRVSMNEAPLPDWEQLILWPGHPAMHGTAGYEHRSNYKYPNGSVISLSGLEEVDHLLSSQFDRIYIAQAEELRSPEIYEKLISRLRWGKTPYHQITLDVNPASEFHWINQRANQLLCQDCYDRGDQSVLEGEGMICPECGSQASRKRMERFLFRHKDNPKWWDHEKEEWTKEGLIYVRDVLGSLTGVQRERLLYHRWVSEEGVALEEYDPATHLVTGRLEKDDTDQWLLHCSLQQNPIPLAWFSLSVDFGWHPDPGVMQVWGHTRDDRNFLVAEVYKTKKQLEWWAEVAADLYNEFHYIRAICDRSRPDAIEALNKRVGPLARNMPMLFQKNTISRDGDGVPGVDHMRAELKNPLTGEVSTYLLRDSLRYGRDEELARGGRPTCTERELHAVVYQKNESGKQNKEVIDKACDDHGFDAWRYRAMWSFQRSIGQDKVQGGYAPGTYGAELFKSKGGWDAILKGKSKKKRVA